MSGPSQKRLFEDILSGLVSDFIRQTVENPQLDDRIPDNAHIIFQINVSPGFGPSFCRFVSRFNDWSRHLALKQAEPGQPQVIATLMLRPPVSPTQQAKEAFMPQLIEQQAKEFELALT